MKKSKILVTFLSVVIMLSMIITMSFIGCKKAEEAAPAEEEVVEEVIEEEAPVEEVAEPVSLVMWWWGEQEAPGLENYVNKMIEKYQELHPNVTVEAVLQTTDGMIPAFQAAIEAGEGPDIQFSWSGLMIMEDVWKGNYLPLNDFVPEEELSHLTNQAEATFGGKLYGYNWYQEGCTFTYNKKLFAEAGLDPKNPPETWDEFMDACEALKNAGITPYAIGMKDLWQGGFTFGTMFPMCIDSMNEYFNLIGGAGGSFADEKYAKWWYRLEELYEKGYINEDVMSLDMYTGQDLFPKGEAAMLTNCQTLLPSWAETLGEDAVGSTTFPSKGETEISYDFQKLASQLCITKLSKNPQEAANFLMFMHQPENTNLLYEMASVIPADDRWDTSKAKYTFEAEIMERIIESRILWFEVCIPYHLDHDGMMVGVSSLFSDPAFTAQDGADLCEDIITRWREQNPELAEKVVEWAKDW